jgi:hypothetical protein
MLSLQPHQMPLNTSEHHGQQKKLPRFRRLDTDHISAIESLFKQHPFLKDRVEMHMPFGRAAPTFRSQAVWLWPKFDKRPVGYLIFLDGFAPCIWFPERQEGLTFRWLLPPSFCSMGATICLANILAGESVLQIEDIIIHEGEDLWSNRVFSERWETLRAFWATLPPHQPFLAFTPRVVEPISLSDWPQHYNPSLYWTIQPDCCRQSRWYWKDVVTAPAHAPLKYIAPVLKRSQEVVQTLCALCLPYQKCALPDTYELEAQDGEPLGLASIRDLTMSQKLRAQMKPMDGLPVEVTWNNTFRKYQIVRIMPEGTPITTAGFFHHVQSTMAPVETGF